MLRCKRFSRLTDDIAVWNRLASQYDIDLYCGWFMEKGNEGSGVSATTLRELGGRGIELSVDIYSGGSDAPNFISHDPVDPPKGQG